MNFRLVYCRDVADVADVAAAAAAVVDYATSGHYVGKKIVQTCDVSYYEQHNLNCNRPA